MFDGEWLDVIVRNPVPAEDAPIATSMPCQVAGIAVDGATIASVVAVLGSTKRPVEMDRARIDRRIRELAFEHAAGRSRR